MPVMTIREAVSQALWEEMERDDRVLIMGEEVGLWGGTYAVTKGFYDHFGAERVRDMPISEGTIIGAAIGAAMNGLKPVAELMTINFAFLALDMLVNQAAKIHSMFGGQFEVPMVVRTTSGGGKQLGATHSQTPDVIFAHFPGLKVIAPGTPADAKGLLKRVESRVAKRAERRHKQLISKGISSNIDGLRAELEARDIRDQTRAVAPLKPAEDALLLDNSDQTIEESVKWVLAAWEQRRPF